MHLALIDEAKILASTLPATALCLDVPTVEIECVRGVVVTMVLGGVFGCACDSIEIRFKSSVQLAHRVFPFSRDRRERTLEWWQVAWKNRDALLERKRADIPRSGRNVQNILSNNGMRCPKLDIILW